METWLAYFDETGDDGITTASSDTFVLTGMYMSAESWKQNFDTLRGCRTHLKEAFGFHASQEMHTKAFLTDKSPYRNYGWSREEKQEILKRYTLAAASLQMKVVNVIIDKEKIQHTEEYDILEKALTYSIQRIENDSKQNGQWSYLIITDRGRIAPMRSTARKIRAYNPIPSRYHASAINQPIQLLIEDILEKDSEESYFIQTCDFISYFVHLYYKTQFRHGDLPNRAANVIDASFPGRVLATLKEGGVLNLQASTSNPYGLVIYPKA